MSQRPKTKLEPGQMFGCVTRDEARELRRRGLTANEWFYLALLRSYDLRRGEPFQVSDDQLRGDEHGETLRRAKKGLVAKGVITVTPGGPRVASTYQIQDLNAHETVGVTVPHTAVGVSAHEDVGVSAHASVGDVEERSGDTPQVSPDRSIEDEPGTSPAPEPVEAGTGTDDSADPWDWQAAHDAGATYTEIMLAERSGRTAEELLAEVEERAAQERRGEQLREYIEANREELMRERGLLAEQQQQPEQQQGRGGSLWDRLDDEVFGVDVGERDEAERVRARMRERDAILAEQQAALEAGDLAGWQSMQVRLQEFDRERTGLDPSLAYRVWFQERGRHQGTPPGLCRARGPASAFGSRSAARPGAELQRPS